MSNIGVPNRRFTRDGRHREFTEAERQTVLEAVAQPKMSKNKLKLMLRCSDTTLDDLLLELGVDRWTS